MEIPDFCVAITGGDAANSLSMHTDKTTMTPGDAFFTMSNGGVCDRPLTNLKDWYDVPFAHYCIDVDIAPPP